MDDELRRLERAAATDPGARERLAHARQRAGAEPPGDVTLHHPFPIRLPFPRLRGQLSVPSGTRVDSDRTYLIFDAVRTELELIHYPWVRSPKEVEAHARVLKLGSTRKKKKLDPATFGPHPCGAGLRYRYPAKEAGDTAVTCLLSAGGERGAVHIFDLPFTGVFGEGPFEVGAPGAWAGAPLVAAAPPWKVGKPGWTLVLPRLDAAALAAVQAEFGLPLDEVRLLKERPDGALFVGFRANVLLAQARLAARGVESAPAWTHSLAEHLPTAPEPPPPRAFTL